RSITPRPAGRSLTPPGGTARAPAGGAGLAAGPVAADAADPGLRLFGARGGECGGGPRTQPGRGHRDHQERLTRGSRGYRRRHGAIETIAWHEIIHQGELHNWRAAQLIRLGFPRPLAEAVADHVDWHEIAALVHRGCGPRLALNIVL